MRPAEHCDTRVSARADQRARVRRGLNRFVPLCLLLVALGCGGSAVSVDELPVEPPETFAASGDAQLPSQWWTAFDDDELNQVIETALTSNFDLLAAAQRVEAARALVRRRRADRLPVVAATGGVDYTADTRDGPPWSATVGAQASYEVDLWGRVAAAMSAEQLRAEASEADMQAAAISVAAEIALTWARLGAAQEDAALIDEQLEINRTVLEMLEERFAVGQVAAADVLRQQELVEATWQERDLIDADVEVARNRLSLLMGAAPHTDARTPSALLVVPEFPDTGVPADLLERRPDVRAAYLRIEAADRDVAAALAARYPQLDLTARLTTGGPAAENIFRQWALTLAGNVFAPLFQGGRIRAEIVRTEAVEQERLFLYGQTVLNALREVEDALILEAREEQRLRRIEARIELATESAERLEARYLSGAGDYLDVLSATTSVQRLERNAIAARRARVEQRIALYRALAGPFETDSREDSP